MTYSSLGRPENVPIVFVEAWNARDPDTLAMLFDEDADFVNVVGLWWHDRDAIRRAHAYGLTHIFGDSTATLGRVKVRMLSDDIAVVHARMRLEGQTPNVNVERPQPRMTVFSFVVHRTADGWRCASAQNTDVVPGMETHVMGEDGGLSAADYRR